MKNIIRNTHIVAALFGSALLFVSSTTAAQSTCKGLENTVCVSSGSCSWVNSYERKDGRTVNGFCRTKAKAKSKIEAALVETKKQSSS